MKKIRVKKKKGFTLIELMLVVTIIVLLLGFLVPKFSSYQDKAKKTKALNTAKQIQTAAMVIYGEKDGKFGDNKDTKEDKKEDIAKDIEELTTATIKSVAVESDGQTLIVEYESDSKACAVTIKASDNSCNLEYDKK